MFVPPKLEATVVQLVLGDCRPTARLLVWRSNRQPRALSGQEKVRFVLANWLVSVGGPRTPTVRLETVRETSQTNPGAGAGMTPGMAWLALSGTFAVRS